MAGACRNLCAVAIAPSVSAAIAARSGVSAMFVVTEADAGAQNRVREV
jgi:hypothetical protein